ncbi:CvpA family protein [Litoreibacter albidus]|uniref:Membrane protein required for colicin V production n=1 Tax=Litoreibacter albidus TaxID=670155 RepID=A0A1H2XV10_9RHOB|nr:CvpA family protein [Litoreibacter albidus]SDW96438.1 membrane protein required for colicin V production [Litoreibacter albidus]
MEGFTIVDGVAAGVIVISAILAYSRGMVREILSIVGWVAAAVVAFIFAPQAVPLAKEIPYLNTLIEGCEPATITAFALVFAVALVIVSIFTPILSGAVQRSVLGGLDQGLGFLFGVARGALLVIVAFVIYDRVVADQAIPMVDDSRTAKVVAQMSDGVDDVIPTDAPGWIVGTYEDLISHCTAPAGQSDA